MRRARTPSSAQRASSSSSASGSPATTVLTGPLTEATETRPGHPAISSRAAADGSATDTIPPRPASVEPIALARRATTRAPSARSSAPQTQAAAISPCECPSTASGSTPYERHSAASDTITAHSAGCTTSTRSQGGVPGSCRRTASSDQSTYGRSASSHSSIRARNTGAETSSSAAIPAHWAPWPGKTNTTRSSPSTDPSTTPGGSASSGSPARRASPAAAASSSSRSPPSTTARWDSRARPVSVLPTSATDSSGRAATCATSRSAWAYSAARSCPESTHGTTPPGTVPDVPGSSSAGGCSRMTWALVPLIPNEDTAARRGRPASGHSRSSVSSSTVPGDQSTSGDGRSTCSVLGSTPYRIAMIILMMPAAPAAACVWPRLDFTDPSHSGCSALRSRP
ncbi:hypothetical protein Save01_09094 [Streptomyces avermitilis]